jgi:hypothetical protein
MASAATTMSILHRDAAPRRQAAQRVFFGVLRMDTVNHIQLDRLSELFCDLTVCLENSDWAGISDIARKLEEQPGVSEPMRATIADLRFAASIQDKPALYFLLQAIDRDISDKHSRQALMNGGVVVTDWRISPMFESVARTFMYVIKFDTTSKLFHARCVDLPEAKCVAQSHHEALERCIGLAAEQIEVMDAIGEFEGTAACTRQHADLV